MHAHGWSDSRIIAWVSRDPNSGTTNSPAPTPPLSMRHIVGGVYFGVILAALTLGVIYGLINDLSRL
jgi:hypothetical protein